MRNRLVNTPSVLQTAISERRKELKMTQTDVAEEYCLRQATVSHFENDCEKSSIGLLFKLIAALDLELHITERNAHFKNEKDEWPEKW